VRNEIRTVVKPVTKEVRNQVTGRVTNQVSNPAPDPTRPDPTRPELLKTRAEAFHHCVTLVTRAPRAGRVVGATRSGHPGDGMMPRSARKVVAS
jgi:hypothetical protein